jgi:hypothetical protein
VLSPAVTSELGGRIFVSGEFLLATERCDSQKVKDFHTMPAAWTRDGNHDLAKMTSREQPLEEQALAESDETAFAKTLPRCLATASYRREVHEGFEVMVESKQAQEAVQSKTGGRGEEQS